MHTSLIIYAYDEWQLSNSEQDLYMRNKLNTSNSRGNMRGVFSQESTPGRATQRPTKVLFFPYKQVSGRNGDHDL